MTRKWIDNNEFPRLKFIELHAKIGKKYNHLVGLFFFNSSSPMKDEKNGE